MLLSLVFLVFLSDLSSTQAIPHCFGRPLACALQIRFACNRDSRPKTVTTTVATETITVTAGDNGPADRLARRQTTINPPCNQPGVYRSACSCLGITATTTTAPTPTSTLFVTRTVTVTVPPRNPRAPPEAAGTTRYRIVPWGLCGTNINGDAFCFEDEFCGAPCAANADCGSGRRCLTGGCCPAGNVCITEAPGYCPAPGATLTAGAGADAPEVDPNVCRRISSCPNGGEEDS
ncbi:hypothetical protein BDV19DRAFT_385263 [Aspergillus venezuelensis]